MPEHTLRSADWEEVAGWFRDQGQRSDLVRRIEAQTEGKDPEDRATLDLNEQEWVAVQHAGRKAGVEPE